MYAFARILCTARFFVSAAIPSLRRHLYMLDIYAEAQIPKLEQLLIIACIEDSIINAVVVATIESCKLSSVSATWCIRS